MFLETSTLICLERILKYLSFDSCNPSNTKIVSQDRYFTKKIFQCDQELQDNEERYRKLVLMNNNYPAKVSN